MQSYSIRTTPDRLESANLQDFHLKWYFAFFIISGFCGLVYEVVWVRLAMASFGVTTALVSIVLSIFMAGLGLGSWGVGVLTRKVSGLNAPRMLRFYSLAELLIGCSALLVPIELNFWPTNHAPHGQPGSMADLALLPARGRLDFHYALTLVHLSRLYISLIDVGYSTNLSFRVFTFVQLPLSRQRSWSLTGDASICIRSN